MKDGRHWRIIPWKNTSGEQYFTLVEEHWCNGAIYYDNRIQMDLEEFEQLYGAFEEMFKLLHCASESK